MGYSVLPNGSITFDKSGYYKQEGLKNNIVDNILQVILNPKNQINLTQPITTDRIKKLAEQSQEGKAAQEMSPFRATSKYNMQIQNMVGKKVIGNVATAIKSFFALSNMYNQAFKEIYDHISKQEYTEARELLKQYTYSVGDRVVTLANVNMDLFKTLLINDESGNKIINPEIPEDIRNILSSVINFEDSLDDMSMLLGELKWVARNSVNCGDLFRTLTTK